jgi:MFS family permease
LYFTYRSSTASHLGLSVSRGDVISVARDLAKAHELIDAANWRAMVDLQPDNDLRHYLATRGTPKLRAAIARIIPPVRYRCVLENPVRNQDSVHLSLSPDGRLLSWQVPPVKPPAHPGSVAEARILAQHELRARLGEEASGFSETGSGVEQHKGTSSEIRSFTFKKTYAPELTVDVHVETSGSQIVAFSITPRVAASHDKQFLELNSAFNNARGITIAVLLIGGVIYVVRRFVRRQREQEVPLKRAGIVALVVFVTFAFSTLAGNTSQRMTSMQYGAVNPRAADIVIMMIASAFMGILVAVTWGTCEADLREAYPEKLASIDAALSGLLSAPSVRSSLAIGLALAGWTLLFSGAEAFVRERMPGSWARISPGELIPYQTSMPLATVTLVAFMSLPLLMAWLLVAASLTHRKGPTPGRRAAMSALMLLFFVLTLLGNYTPFAWGFLVAAISAATLVVPFLIGDLLAVILASAVSTAASVAASFLAQPLSSLRNGGWMTLALLAVIVVIAVLQAFRKGDAPDAEADVARPEYAQNITQRLLLRTEMDAARQAQLRVMPRVVQSVEGFRLAARHSEAAELGSDYFEVFPSQTHVAVAVADARLPGLSSALCVSMLKGLLLNYTTRVEHPREIADRVYGQLSKIFGDDLPLSFFFGRLDRATGELLFATFGDMPHGVLIRPAASEDPVLSLEGEEFVRLEDGAVVIYTAPLSRLHDRDGSPLGDDAIHRELLATGRPDPASMVEALSALAKRHARDVEESHAWTAIAFALAEGSR